LVTREVDPNLVIGTLFFLIPYNLLMYGVNDVFDYESDLRNPRKGGIEGALLNPKWHRITLWSAALSCIPFIAYLMAVGSVSSNLWLALFVFTVIAYSAKHLRFKERPFLDSLTSASHFVGPMIFGLALAGENPLGEVTGRLVLAFTLWGVASHAFGAVQDVKADREAEISSIATAIGARATVRLAFGAYLFAALVLVSVGPLGLVASIAFWPYLAVVAPFWRITDETCELANRGWKRFIWLNYFAGMVVSFVLIWMVLYG
jgi:4-hydroxybenzoate polyprenyltransferase